MAAIAGLESTQNGYCQIQAKTGQNDVANRWIWQSNGAIGVHSKVVSDDKKNPQISQITQKSLKKSARICVICGWFDNLCVHTSNRAVFDYSPTGCQGCTSRQIALKLVLRLENSHDSL